MVRSPSSQFIEKQEQFYNGDLLNQNRIASPGSQYIIQLIKGGYLQNYNDAKKRKVLDVGCGAGYNLVSFAMMGWKTYGCEISDDIARNAAETVRRYGLDVEIVVGENQCIPYPSNSFDLLVSANVIHYEHSEEGMKNSIREYARVLRRSGRLLMLTTHPENWILKGCSWLGKHLARVNNPEDFRNGEILFVFQNETEAKDYLSEYFADIKAGINQLDLFKRKIISFVITGLKR